MANVIKIKRSTTTATPLTLAEGELAYSELSGNLFIGTAGNNQEKIGGNTDVLALAGAVLEADYNANTILAATADNTPVALTIAASTIVGRTAAGSIDALTPTETRLILNVEDNAAADQTAAEVTSTATGTISATDVQSAIAELESEKLGLVGGTLTGVLTLAADPANPLEAATRAYVDSVAQGLDAKDSVLNASTANLTLSGEQTIDGVLTSASRILVKNQTLPRDNGIYVTAAGGWARSVDANTWDELVSAFVFVETGTANADSGWVCTANAGGTLGTTDVTWVQFSQAGSYTADGLGIELVGSEFQLELDGTTLSKTASGLKANLGGINHDGLLNYDANDHIDHTTVTLTAGLGLAGGGTIAANRTFDLAINTLTTLTPSIGSADFLVFYDTANTTHKKILINDLLDGGTF